MPKIRLRRRLDRPFFQASAAIFLLLAGLTIFLFPAGKTNIASAQIIITVPAGAMAAGDFDEDGIDDIVIGVQGQAGGLACLYRGNTDARYPNTPEAQQRKQSGLFTTEPFPFQPVCYAAPVRPDLIGVGDFDGDGHLDIVGASFNVTELFLLSGDGTGGLMLSKEIPLPAFATAIGVGDFGKPDGIPEVILGVGKGPDGKVLIFSGPDGALQTEPEIIPVGW